MKDIQKRIRRLAEENRQRSRMLAFLLALSLIFVFIVPFAAAPSGRAISNSNLNDGIPYMTEALTSAPDGSTDMDGNIDKITVQVGDSVYTKSLNDPAPRIISVDGGNGNSVDVMLELEYQFDNAEKDRIVQTPYVYYYLEAPLSIPNDLFDAGMFITDDDWSKTKTAAYFSISRETGLIVIHYTDAYVEYMRSTAGIEGTLRFNATLSRGNTEEGDATANISGFQIQAEFSDRIPSMEKNGVVRNENGRQYIDWILTVQNPDGLVDLSNYSISDTLNSEAIDWNQVSNLTFNPPGSGQLQNGSIQLNDSKPARTVQISYTTEAALGETYDNRASLEGKGNTIPAQKEISIVNGLDVGKSGQAGYKLTNVDDEYVQWQISLSHKSGDSLHNVVVTELDCDFGNDIAVYDAVTGAAVTDFTVNGRTLTFGSDTGIPSAVRIVFSAPAAQIPTQAQQSVQLSNSIVAERPGDISPTPATGYEQYRNTFAFSKTRSALNEETGTLEWQFNMRSNSLNGDYNNLDWDSKRSINGYQITDEAFQTMTDAEIESKLGFNFYYNTTQLGSTATGELPYNFRLERTASDTLTVVFDETDPAYNKETPVNAIKIYYKDTIENYMTKNMPEGEYQKYLNGEQAELYNYADATDGGSIIVHSGENPGIQQRVAVTKYYFGADNDENVSLGQQDTDDRILTWEGRIEKSLGIRAGDYYTDVLLSDLNGVQHYITPAQRSTVTAQLIGKETGSSTAEPLDSSMYTLTFYTDTGCTQEAAANEDAVAFRITFTNAIETKTYRDVEFRYSTTAATSDVPNGSSVKFSNGYGLNQTPPDQIVDGMTYTREDPEDVKPMTLNLKKIWQDNNNLFNSRPDTITVRVYQAEVDGSGNVPAADDAGSWTEYAGSPYTLTVSSGSVDTVYSLGTDFPQWRYDADSGTAVRYCYRIEEDTVNGYQLISFSDPAASSAFQEMSLTNKSDQDFGKYAADSSAGRIRSAELSSVPRRSVTVGGTVTECYLIRWIVAFERGCTETFTDTLPANAVYITGSEPGMSAYAPKAVKFENGYYEWPLDNWNITASQSGSTLTFSNAHYETEGFAYYTAIPVSELGDLLDENGDLVNRVSKDGTEAEAALHLSGSGPDNQKPTITKKRHEANPGYLVYYFDFNPDGRMLSNSGMVDITDDLTFRSEAAGVSLEDLDISLDSVEVFPLVDGQPDENNPLNGSQYSYHAAYNASRESVIDSSEWTDVNERKTWTTTALSPGDQVTLTVKYDQIPTFQTELVFSGSDHYNSEYGAIHFNNITSQLDGTGSITLEFTVPSVPGVEFYKILDYNWPFEIVSASVHSDVPARLEISVPDRTPLRVQYTYHVTGWETGTQGLKFSNTAEFEADNDSGSSSTGWSDLNTTASGHVETIRRPRIFKTDVSNEALNYLDAKFKIAKYDSDLQQWVYAVSFPINQEDARNVYREIIYSDPPVTESESTYPVDAGTLEISPDLTNNFDLEEGVLYKFVEIDAPEGYRQPHWSDGFAGNEEFIFYFAYGSFSGTVPDDAAGKVETIEKKVVNIKNSKNISLSAVKSFSGAESNIPDESEVTLGLYWSYTKKGTDLRPVSPQDLSVPADFVQTKTVTYQKDGSATAAAVWEDLPNGKGHDPIYYFIREESYKIGNKTYTYDPDSGTYVSGSEAGIFRPVYTRNGTNTNGTQIEVNNSEGIMVRKLWANQQGKPVTPPNDVGGASKMEVGFTVYGILDGLRIELVLPVNKLNEANNYMYALPDTVTDTDGNSYQLTDFDNYEIAESLTDEQLALLDGRYLPPVTTRKITDKTGVLEIINTSTLSPDTNAAVTKIWRDGGIDHSEDTLTFELLQSTSANLTSEELAAYAAGGAVTGVYSKNAFRSTNEVKVIPLGEAKQFTFENQIISGVSGAGSGCTVTYNGDTLTITGTAESSTELEISFTDGTQTAFTATVIPFEVELGGQDGAPAVWNKTWSSLPYFDSDTEQYYYYYVIEKDVPENYSVTYRRVSTASDQQITITNSLPTQIAVQKQWCGQDGSPIVTDSSDPAYNAGIVSALPETVSVQVFRKVKTDSDQTNVNMPGADADPVSDFGGASNCGTYTLNRSDGYRLVLSDLDARNASGDVYIYYFKEAGTHILNGSSYQLSNQPYIAGVTYTNNGLTADTSAEVTLTNRIPLLDLPVIKQWNDDRDHAADTVTIRIHRETAADPPASQENPLILNLSVPEGSTVQIPKSGSSVISSNIPVQIEANTDAPVTWATDSGMKIWTLTPKADAQPGDEAELTFATEDGQTAVIRVQIISDPLLELTLDKTTCKADEAAPNVQSVDYTPAGGDTAQDVRGSASYTSSNSDVIAIDPETGAMTITGVGSADITASYTVDGVTLTSARTVTVTLPDSFSVTGPDTVNTDETVQLGIDKPFGTFTWSSSDPGIASVDPDTGEVTGVSEGTVTITATRHDGATAVHEITVEELNQPISGTVGDRLKENKTYSYVYDPAQHTITVTGYFEEWGSGAYPALDTVPELMNLIPVKHEVLSYQGTVQWTLNDFGLNYVGSAVAETPGNTKSFAEMTSDNNVKMSSAGERTIVITVKSEGGNDPGTVTEQIVSNQNFGGDGKIYLNRIVCDGEVTIQLRGEPYAYYQLAVSGRESNNNWSNYPSNGITGNLDGDGNATITYQLPVTLSATELQLWDYRKDNNGIDKTGLTVVSCTAQVPDTGGNSTNAAPAQGRSLMRRFSTGALRMGSAEAYVSIPLAAPLRAGEPDAAAAEASAFSSSGTMDITLKATDNWQKLITGLPVYTVAADGTVYTNYYWAEEIALNGNPVAGYQSAYTFTDGDAATSYTVNAAQPGEQPSVVIRNTPTEEAVELPVTGGRKVSGYCFAGGVLLLLSAAGLIYQKRRRWLND